jgi:aspartyl protease family protein
MTLDINDVPVKFVVDTGASDMVLTLKDAERVGLNRADLQFFGRAMTANGEVRIAPVRLDKVSVGGLSDMRVSASVNEGEMTQSLLGMSYLQRWDRIEIVGDELILTR